MDSPSKENKKTEDIEIPKDKMFVKVYAPYKNYFEGLANSISAVNDTGPFDILPGHHRFLTLLSEGDITIRDDSDKEEVVSIKNGIMYVLSDKVTVFLDV